MADAAAIPFGAGRASTRTRDGRGILVGLLVLAVGVLVAVAVSISAPASPSIGAGAVSARDGLGALLRLPPAARGPISAALGRDSADYRITGLTVTNPAQRLSGHFGVSGVVVRSGTARFKLGLIGIGRGQTTGPAGPVAPVTLNGSVVYARPAVRETWSNGPLGLEQSFVLARRPSGTGALTLAVRVPAAARLVGHAIRLPGGLRYTGLRATDAHGGVLRSWLSLRDGRALLHVSDVGAAYPITVDPLVEQAELTEPGNPTGQDEFGYSVAISGTTIVVGASHVNTGGQSASGAAYVFQQGSGGSWTEEATLTPSDPVATTQFGYSVAISGNTIVVGEAPAPGVTYSLDPPENVYIFEAQNGVWKSGTQTSELSAQVGGGLAPSFGVSVAVAGNTVVVGAPDYQASVGDPLPGGAAFVYTISNGTPTGQPAELTTAPPSAGSNCPCAAHYQDFGQSVAVSGSTILVGAPSSDDPSEPGAAYIYSENGSSWTTTTSPSYALAASDPAAGDGFGLSVAIDGSTAVVAAPNHSGSSSGTQQHEGALYVFDQQNGGGWPATQSAELTPSDPTNVNNTGLGFSGVAISGSTIVGGTPYSTGSLNSAAGYLFTEPTGGWSGSLNQTQRLSPTALVPASNAGNAATVTAVGISGSTVVLGSDTGASYGSGQVFVFGPQAATTPTTTTTTTTTSTVGAASAGKAVVSGESVTTKATCAGAATASCHLSYALTSRETTKHGKAIAVAASKKTKRITKTVTIGSAKLVLDGGGSQTMKLSLNRSGRALLAKFRKLPAYLTVSEAQTAGAEKVISKQKVMFRAKQKKKKRT